MVWVCLYKNLWKFLRRGYDTVILQNREQVYTLGLNNLIFDWNLYWKHEWDDLVYLYVSVQLTVNHA